MVNPKVWCLAALIYGLFILYYLLYSRHHLVEGTPEQEFASIEIRDE
jgi:ethanolamine permease